MIFFSHFNKEIAAKILGKFAGIFKQLAVLFYIGVSDGLDAFYVASSFCGIILALVAWSEVVLLPDFASADADKLPDLFFGTLKNVAFISLFLSSITVFLGGVLFGEGYLGWLVILSCWAILNVLNNCYMLLFRVQSRIDLVANYYRFSSAVGALLFVVGASVINFFSDDSELLVWLLATTILLPELYFSSRFFRESSIIWRSVSQKTLSLLDFIRGYIFMSRSVASLVVIVLVFGIDAIDKYFTTLPSISPNGASILVYGALIPLAMRVALDAKTLFYTALNQPQGLSGSWRLMWKTHAKVMRIYIPFISCATICCWLVGKNVLGFLGVSESNAAAIINVFYIYVLLIPLYILWDFIYRVYHVNQRTLAISILVGSGFLINASLNYIFVLLLGMGSEGIALSTLMVYLAYCVIGVVDIFFRLKH